MRNYKNIFRINEHQIFAEIDGVEIIVSDLDDATKDIFIELESQSMGTYEQWQEYEKSKISVAGYQIPQNKIREIEIWFEWYDIQVAQAERATRQGKEWFAVYEPTGKRYETIQQLDEEADILQLELSNLRRESN